MALPKSRLWRTVTILRIASLGAVFCVSGILDLACTAAEENAPTLGRSVAEPAITAGPSVLRPPDGSRLQPVTLPDFSRMVGPAEEQMRAQHSSLQARIEDPGTVPVELGAAYGRMGMLFMAATYLDAAEACFLNAQELAPSDVRWPYYLGRLYQIRGPLEKSAFSFARVLELQPSDIVALVLLGEVRLAQGQAEEAEPLFARALSLQPGLAPAHFGAGRVALATEDHARAVEQLEEALALDPQASTIHYPLAMAYRGLGDADKAQAHLQDQGDVETLLPDPLKREMDELLESPNAYNMRGGRALEVGNYPAAAEYFRRGLELAPSDPSLRHRLGTALFQLGDASGAQQQFEQVVRTSPEHSRAQFSLGVLLAANGQHEEAIERFTAALEYEPGYIQARVQLAGLLGRSGRAEGAFTAYERVLEMDPTFVEATFGSAMALVRLHRYDEARDRLTRGMRTNPEQSMFKHALARLLAAAPDDSVRDGRQALTLVEELLENQQNIGLGETAAMALAELGEYAQAVMVQRDVMAAAEQAGFGDVVERLEGNLRLYERGDPCRTPFTEDELP